MCGIIGSKGKDNIIPILINGLKRLEYRGYDSAGIAYIVNKQIIIEKKTGRIADLEKSLKENTTSDLGIGHTRWATHGKVNHINAHPHLSFHQKVCLVHNGVIDNHIELRKWLEFLGYQFITQTDTEVIVNLLEYFSKNGDFLSAIKKTMDQLEGNFALAIINQDDDKLYFAKRFAPLYIGLGNEQNYVVSDILAALSHTKKFMMLEDNQYGFIDNTQIKIYKQGEVQRPEIFICNIEEENAEKGLYPHYMLKEIEEQPSVIRRILNQYLDQHGNITFKPEFKTILNRAKRIYIIACGTSYHAGLVGRYFIETRTDLEVFVQIASEFAYFPPKIPQDSLFIFISQSGETADLKKALEVIRKTACPVVTLTNVTTSYLARLADCYLDLCAGPEIAVASTKAYIAQVTLLSLIASYLKKDPEDLFNKFNNVILSVDDIIHKKEQIRDLVEKYLVHNENMFFIGRGIDYLACQEASLKTKEISYIHSEAFQAGELKHGSIALIGIDVPIVGLISNAYIAKIMRTNLEEVKARGAQIITIVQDSIYQETDSLSFKDCDSLLNIIPQIVICQYLAYYCALFKNNDVDKPRNLAKSVTVE